MLNILGRYLVIAPLLLSALSLQAKPLDQTAHNFRQHRLCRVNNGIRIYLSEMGPNVALRVEGGYGIYDPAQGKRLTGGLLSKTFPLSGDQEGLCWGETLPDLYQMTVVPEGDEKGFYLQDQFFPGILHIYLVEGKLELINEISLEDYALAICSDAQREFPLETEALASLAICARTRALAYSKLRTGCYWHAEAKRSNYRGVDDSSQLEKGRKSQIKTRDLVIAFKNKRYLIPEWTGNCAGHTADYNVMHAKDALFPKGQTKGVQAVWAGSERDQNRWQLTFSEKELARAFSLKCPLQTQLKTDGESGKVIEFDVSDNHQKKILNFYFMQKILGPSFKSSEFEISVDQLQKRISFDGYGEGSGVGLCLFSADKMAKEGKSAKEILNHFFPNSDLHLIDLKQCDIDFQQ